MGQKEPLDVTQAGDLEHLRLLLNHLPGEPKPWAGKGAKEEQPSEDGRAR